MKILVKYQNLQKIVRVKHGPLLILFTTTILPTLAQQPQALRSPEVHSDNRVTFRFRAPNAKEIFLVREGAQRLPMQKDEQGVWSVTMGQLEPDFYGYLFLADGVIVIDPFNSLTKPNLLNPQSVVHVPGPASLPWEVNNVPHGTIHRHFYKSGVVGDDRDFYVYTLPGYDPKAKRTYPVRRSSTPGSRHRVRTPGWSGGETSQNSSRFCSRRKHLEPRVHSVPGNAICS